MPTTPIRKQSRTAVEKASLGHEEMAAIFRVEWGILQYAFLRSRNCTWPTKREIPGTFYTYRRNGDALFVDQSCEKDVFFQEKQTNKKQPCVANEYAAGAHDTGGGGQCWYVGKELRR